MENTFDDDAEADGNEDDGEDGFPSDVVGEDILSGKEKNNADADED